MELTQILQKALEIGGSDIFLIPGSAATAKVKGHLVQLTEEKLLPADTADMIREAYGMAGDHSDELLHRDGDDDFSFSFNRQARFRCNAYKQRGTLAATCRATSALRRLRFSSDLALIRASMPSTLMLSTTTSSISEAAPGPMRYSLWFTVPPPLAHSARKAG